MNYHSISAITARIDSFPPLPAVVTRLMQITADPNSSAEDLTKTIGVDPGLATIVLKLANSAFFGRVMAVSSLKEAIAALGFSEIRNLVLSKAVFSSFRHLKKSNAYDIRKFWEHSFLCGLAAKIIAIDLKRNTGDFFMAGLIHDIGKLILFIEMPEQFLETVEAPGDSPFMTVCKEKSILGIGHDDVGRMLLNKWLFPENLLSAVGFHHRPEEAKTAPEFPIVVNAADMLAHLANNTEAQKADSDLMRTVFHPQIVKLLNLHKISLDTGTFGKYLEKLNMQKQVNAGLLSLLLS